MSVRAEAAPLVGVLALQGDVREHEAALAELGARTRRVRRPADLGDLDGLVIPGGESTTLGLLLTEFELLEPLRAAVRAGVPTYGSCAGMVLLADRVVAGVPGQPLVGGLDVTVRRNAFGRQVDSFEGPVDVEGVPGGPVAAVFIRAPWIEELGPSVVVLGTFAGRVVVVRQGVVLASAFHPELTGDRRMHRLFLDIVEAQRHEAEGTPATP